MKVCPPESWRFCGRTFSAEELAWMRSLLSLESLNRHRLARRVCQQLHWVNGAGKLKEMSCRVAMLRMEGAGLLRLPAPLQKNRNGLPIRGELKIQRPEGLLTQPADQLDSLRMELVQTKPGAGWYRSLMAPYHYLGCKPMCGAQLRYLIWSGRWLLGGLGFGAAAWSVAARDRWIGWSSSQREQRLERIVNHSRFLLLPWVQCRNLASWIFAQVTRQLPQDWQARYGYRPVLLESFVELDRFSGACYQAANWLCLGQTKGRGKLEKNHAPVVPIKRIFVYPLRRSFRDILLQ